MTQENLDDRLTAAREAQAEQHRLKRTTASLEADLVADMERLVELADVLERELHDVDKLEGLSLQALFYGILGRVEQRLEKERQEYLAARLKHGRLSANILEQERELAAARTRLHALGDPITEYENLLAEKAARMSSADDETALLLIDLGRRRAAQADRCELIDEAQLEGAALVAALDKVIEHLKNAESWGTWDLLGGGLVATALKHSAIDDAKQAVEGLQVSLKRFRRVMEEADLEGKMLSELIDFDIFADYFLDNLIMDWVVQKRIQGSLEHVIRTRNRVTDSIEQLRPLAEDHARRLRDLEADWRETVEES